MPLVAYLSIVICPVEANFTRQEKNSKLGRRVGLNCLASGRQTREESWVKFADPQQNGLVADVIVR